MLSYSTVHAALYHVIQNWVKCECLSAARVVPVRFCAQGDAGREPSVDPRAACWAAVRRAPLGHGPVHLIIVYVLLYRGGRVEGR